MRAELPHENRYLDQIPPTPLVPVKLDADGPSIWCKLEFLNPSGSTKDRIARFILTKAFRQGKIGPGSRVIEASSGSTSIAMALASAQLGMKFTAVMPEGVSNERSMIIASFGGESLFSPRDQGIHGAVAMAAEIAKQTGAFLPLQFENPDNPAAHRFRTAIEIIEQVPSGKVDGFVSGVGTGGTLVGIVRGCHDHGSDVVPFAAKPISGKLMGGADSCSFSTRIPGVAQGISKIFSPEVLPGLVELEVDDQLALDTARRLIRMGFPVGPSSGLNFAAAAQAQRQLGPDATVVTVFPDRMERYFSTELFRGM